MSRVLAILLVALPLTEIALFVAVGSRIGALGTIGLVLLAALAGSLILRRRGLAAARGLQRPLSGLLLVAEEALIVVAALLLILPGFLTDLLAVILLIRPLRRLLIALIAARVASRMTTGQDGFRPTAADDVIDAEYVDLGSGTTATLPPAPVGKSGWTRH